MQKQPRPPLPRPLPRWWKPRLKSPLWIKPKLRTKLTRLPRPPVWPAPMPRPCPKVLLPPPCRSALASPALVTPLTVRTMAQRPVAFSVARPLPHRRFVLFHALCPGLPPRRIPAPPAPAMVAPAVIRHVTALAGPAAIRPETAPDPAAIRHVMALADLRVLAAPVAPVAPVVRPVLLAAPVPVAPVAALGSRLLRPRPLIPAMGRARRSALRVAALLTSSRAILVAVPTMMTAVV